MSITRPIRKLCSQDSQSKLTKSWIVTTQFKRKFWMYLFLLHQPPYSLHLNMRMRFSQYMTHKWHSRATLQLTRAQLCLGQYKYQHFCGKIPNTVLTKLKWDRLNNNSTKFSPGILQSKNRSPQSPKQNQEDLSLRNHPSKTCLKKNPPSVAKNKTQNNGMKKVQKETNKNQKRNRKSDPSQAN